MTERVVLASTTSSDWLWRLVASGSGLRGLGELARVYARHDGAGRRLGLSALTQAVLRFELGRSLTFSPAADS
jgi:hypothetical protein